MQFNFKSLIVALVSSGALVMATPVNKRTANPPPPSSPPAVSQCNVGNIQCCQSTYESDSTQFSLIKGLLGIALPIDDLLVGVQCTPILSLGGLLDGSETCSFHPVCCSNNNFNGLINVGCSPITL